MNGFRKCGIWPLDRNVFTEADFIAAETTNTETLPSENINLESTSQDPASNLLEAIQPEISLSEVAQVNSAPTNISVDRSAAEPVSSEISPQPATSGHLIKEKTPERQIQSKSSFSVTPENIIGIPKEVRTQERKTRKRGKTAILTASPYKNELIRDKNKKQEVNNKKKPDNKKAKKQNPEKNKAGKKNSKRRKKESDTDSSEDNENDCPCLYCGYLYSQSTEGWVSCGVCHGWAHNSCAGVDDDDEEAHICERCQPD
ncbi:uncharacterized protein C01G6.5-like [Zerene cesonia]|uniref:uncharacterized protein C01G6.5-like n=1 Tax=Zerene cesonia TaxID=33412 RepID=UPI0018E537F8|nr:uncharacterized protein C01G6.5-like [Zerene cesonia]